MKIVLLEQRSIGMDLDYSRLYRLGSVTANPGCGEEEMKKLIKDADIIVGNKFFFGERTLDEAPHLKLICITSTGYDNCDLDYLKKRGVALCNVAAYSTDSVAQHTFALLFRYMEKISEFEAHVHARDFIGRDLHRLVPYHFFELRDKTWGIIGLGNIGKRVAEIASAFGCRVIYYSASGENRDNRYERVSIEELLRQSDVLSIHAPLNEKTSNLLTVREFQMMKPTACLINVGRGGIANEADLAEAVRTGIIGGACIDVYEKEPIREDSPYLGLSDYSNLILTPHIAWAAKESRQRSVNETAANIESFFSGGKRNRIV